MPSRTNSKQPATAHPLWVSRFFGVPDSPVMSREIDKLTMGRRAFSVLMTSFALATSGCGEDNPLIGKWGGGNFAVVHNLTMSFTKSTAEASEPAIVWGERDDLQAVSYRKDGDYMVVVPTNGDAHTLKIKVIDHDTIMLVADHTAKGEEVGPTLKRTS